jgi:hypothetical protein
MAIVALLLWAFTAAAGFYLLVTSNLARTRQAAPARVPPAHYAQATASQATAGHATASQATAGQATAGHATASQATAGHATASQATAGQASTAAPAAQAQAASPTEPAPGGPASPRELRHATRTRWDPPSLVAAREAPMLPGLRSLLEFAHPTFGIIGLAFWLGFTLVHNKALGWIAFGLVAVTASLGLTWFTANLRAARRAGPDRGAPRFSGRLLVLHGSAAALTFILAAVTALVTRG